MNSGSNTLLDLFNRNMYHDIIASCSSLEINSIPVEHLNLYAISLFKVGSYDLCIPVLNRLEAFLPSDPNFLSLCGATYRRLAQYKKASEYLSKALSLEPNSLDIKNNYANLLIDMQSYDKAKLLLDEIISVNPEHPDALINLQRLSRLVSSSNISIPPSTDNSLQPFQVFDPLLLAFSEDESVRTTKSFSTTKNPQSESLANTVVKPSEMDLVEDLMALCRRYISESLHEDALKICSQILSKGGASPQVYEYASDAYLGLRRFHQSEVCLLISYILGSRSSKVLLNLISFTSMRSDHTLSEHIFNKASESDPSNPFLAKFEKLLFTQKSSASSPFKFETWSLPNR